MTTPTLSAICIDCADASATAAFWAGLLGGEATHDADGVAAVAAGTHTLYFDEVDGFEPPGWPADTKQFHLDLHGEDPPSHRDRIEELGGSMPDFQPGGDRWTVFLDPAGHPFCIAAQPG